jgi:hypothetical protein
MDVHPPKNGINRYWSIAISTNFWRIVRYHFGGHPQLTVRACQSRIDFTCTWCNQPLSIRSKVLMAKSINNSLKLVCEIVKKLFFLGSSLYFEHLIFMLKPYPFFIWVNHNNSPTWNRTSSLDNSPHSNHDSRVRSRHQVTRIYPVSSLAFCW